MSEAPRLRVVEAVAYERPVRFRMPFRFGAADVHAAPQAFVRVVVEDAAGRAAAGWAAEMMMPRWFDKSPDLSAEDNVVQLRASTHVALDLMRRAGADTAFGLHARSVEEQYERCRARGLGGLVAGYGQALVDRAVIDALCRLVGAPGLEVVRANLLGIDARLTPDLADFDLTGFLADRPFPTTIEARHTVGLGDPLTQADIERPLDDRLPHSLDQAIATYGHRTFKLKLSGDVDRDLARLRRIVAVLDRLAPAYRATLDGNEQFTDHAPLEALLDALVADPALASLRAGLLFVEQPFARSVALARPLGTIAERFAFEIDESDDEIGAYPRALASGYRGVSSKSCKGFYRAVLNAARAARAPADRFVSAEDLTVQPGIALGQDLFLAAITGNAHVERNGHHFAGAMENAPAAERARFVQAHPDLYRKGEDDRIRLLIAGGRIALDSTRSAIGLGCATAPEPNDLDLMPSAPEVIS